MKKVTLFLAALLVAGSSFAFDGKCCKDKKEKCSKEKKEACAKDKGCCKKGKKSSEKSEKMEKSAAETK
ncbi:MAG: hypothetical protein IT256_01760 [Chitinophagaceae bacterium]|nr:hypothetical protein [Chitinophagaceae bacterium]